MRNLHTLDNCRLDVRDNPHFGWNGDDKCGAFKLPSPTDGQSLRVVASNGDGWDHVSVSRQSRCPNWIEMDFVKRKFFEDSETAMQLHVPVTDHINRHPFTLHLWMPKPETGLTIPMPPKEMV
jgi:hypothetical protein